ncbi:MAG: hypothetical protein ACP5IM_02070 [Candidatus Bathyarchaeia archaeon]|nr:MAG: hypothetical protein C0195_00660 [Candidatus Bathyarchaeota archaeon]
MKLVGELSAAIGFCIAAPIPENKHYGFPMTWRVIDAFTGENSFTLSIFVDFVFWTVMVAILISLMKIAGRLL